MLTCIVWVMWYLETRAANTTPNKIFHLTTTLKFEQCKLTFVESKINYRTPSLCTTKMNGQVTQS